MRKETFNITDFFISVVLVLLGAATLYPFLNILALSLNNAMDSVRGGIGIWPRVFTLRNYQEVFTYPTLLSAFEISVLRTVLATVVSICCTSMLAYTLSREDFFARKFFTTLFVITMYVGGGLIPYYMVLRQLHLLNSFLVYLIPGMVGVWNMIVLRTYIQSLPPSLQESARLDGANDFVIFWKVIFPLCTPVVAALSLFVAVDNWNAWFDTYIFCSGNKALNTLQFELQRILNAVAAFSSNPDSYRTLNGNQATAITPQAIKMAITMVVTVPVLLIYPFIQKYFVKGIMIGAVKG